MKRLTWLSLVSLVATAALAGCGGGSSNTSPSTSTSAAAPKTGSTGSSTTTASTTVISSRSVPGLGTVLVNGQGRTLYMFMPDKHTKVTCVGACAQLWPPAKLAGAKAGGSGVVKVSLLSSDSDPEGGRVVTYAGWPLYTYISDSAPGQATGQGLETSGGKWYVIAPSGVPVTKTP